MGDRTVKAKSREREREDRREENGGQRQVLILFSSVFFYLFFTTTQCRFLFLGRERKREGRRKKFGILIASLKQVIQGLNYNESKISREFI